MLNTSHHNCKRQTLNNDLLLQLNAIFHWTILQRQFAAIQLFAKNHPYLLFLRHPSPELLRIGFLILVSNLSKP